MLRGPGPRLAVAHGANFERIAAPNRAGLPTGFAIRGRISSGTYHWQPSPEFAIDLRHRA